MSLLFYFVCLFCHHYCRPFTLPSHDLTFPPQEFLYFDLFNYYHSHGCESSQLLPKALMQSCCVFSVSVCFFFEGDCNGILCFLLHVFICAPQCFVVAVLGDIGQFAGLSSQWRPLLFTSCFHMCFLVLFHCCFERHPSICLLIQSHTHYVTIRLKLKYCQFWNEYGIGTLLHHTGHLEVTVLVDWA